MENESWVYEQPKKKGEPFPNTKENRETIERLAGLGLTTEQTANYFGIHKDSFKKMMENKKDVKQAWIRGQSKGIAMVAKELIKQIKNGSTQATIFYLKSVAGWRDDKELDRGVSEKEVATVTINVNDPIEAAKLYQEIMRGGK